MHLQKLTMLDVLASYISMQMLVVLMDVALLMLPFGTAVPLSAFYSYGSAVGDSVLPPTDDGSSPAITLPAPFLFFTTYYTPIYVSYAVVSSIILDSWYLVFDHCTDHGTFYTPGEQQW